MISVLHIKNIALINDITVELTSGLNILSGETGAGKSIIIDSLEFVLGERADKTLIRYGEEQAIVEAVFDDYLNPSIKSYMEEIGVEAEDVLIIRRLMTASGKNECRINGHSVTLTMLKGLTEKLADIHGQHEHQSLLKTNTHIDLLDSFGETEIINLKAQVKDDYKAYTELKNSLKKYGNADERARRVDILGYQIEEIKKAQLVSGEEDKLIADRKKFRNIEKITNALRDSKAVLSGNESSVAGDLNRAKQFLGAVSDFDDEILNMTERLNSAKIEVQDISETISGILEKVEFDDYSAEKVEKRLETIRSIIKKYGGSVENTLDYLVKSQEEFELLNNAADTVDKLEKQLKSASDKLQLSAEKLSKSRKKFAVLFETAIKTELSELGMGGSTFKVNFAENENYTENTGSNGFDNVEFLISPNIGEPLKPLAKIISGGEMSRFMLALKNIIAKLDNISTMVFDEIDTGISGKIAQVVAEKLYNISVNRQVIAVTHLPQLASMADRHLLISKSVEDGKTNTHLLPLSDEDTLSEISRLIGGSDYSGHALPHAKEMKAYSASYKIKVQNSIR